MKLTASTLRRIIREEVEEATMTQAPRKKAAPAAPPPVKMISKPAGERGWLDVDYPDVPPAKVAKVIADAMDIPIMAKGRNSGVWLKDARYWSEAFGSSGGRMGVELPFTGALEGSFYCEIRPTHLKEMGFSSIAQLSTFIRDQGAKQTSEDEVEAKPLEDKVGRY